MIHIAKDLVWEEEEIGDGMICPSCKMDPLVITLIGDVLRGYCGRCRKYFKAIRVCPRCKKKTKFNEICTCIKDVKPSVVQGGPSDTLYPKG